MYPLRHSIAGEVEEKEELKNLLMWSKLSFHVVVDRKIYTYMKVTLSPESCLAMCHARETGCL